MKNRSVLSVLLLCTAIFISGCALETTSIPVSGPGSKLQGTVYGGQQPVSQAHVYLMAANTTGYGGNGIAASTSNASVSLLNATITGNSDSVGAYVLTDSNGSFLITGDYICSANQQVYIYVLGGNSGSGSNSAIGLMAVLGACPLGGTFAVADPIVAVNEVTTVAAAYALAGFATDATHISSSGTPPALTGIANAFANAANLGSITTGTAPATTTNAYGKIVSPQSNVNTLANILAACVNTTSSTPLNCPTLLSTALSGGNTGTSPTDTATAAINIAHNQGANIATLYPLVSSSPPFLPALSSQPNDFSLPLAISGGGLQESTAIAIDAQGNAWIANTTPNVAKFSPGGISANANGYTTPDLSNPLSIAIDNSGNVWIGNDNGSSSGIWTLSELSSAGGVLSGSGFTGGGLISPKGIAIDATGNVWTANYANGTGSHYAGGSVSEFSSTGTPISPATNQAGNIHGGYILGVDSSGNLGKPSSLAIDANGNVWVGNYGGASSPGLSELSSSGSLLSPTGNSPLGYSFVGGNVYAVAITSSGNVFLDADYYLDKYSNAGALLSEYQSMDFYNGFGMAADGNSNLWICSFGPPSLLVPYQNVTGFSSSGTVLTGADGLQATNLNPTGIAIDGSGNIWVSNGAAFVTEFVGAAVPVVTPIAAGVKNNTIGTRP
jgi:hypothetical protein